MSDVEPGTIQKYMQKYLTERMYCTKTITQDISKVIICNVFDLCIFITFVYLCIHAYI